MTKIKNKTATIAPEPTFFLVEWSKSRESKIAILHQNPEEGIAVLESILKKTYQLSDDPSLTPITPTEETLAKANLGKIVEANREELIEIYPHPYHANRVLLEGQEGDYFEIHKDKSFIKETVKAKSPILEFWMPDDGPLFNFLEDDYFHL